MTQTEQTLAPSPEEVAEVTGFNPKLGHLVNEAEAIRAERRGLPVVALCGFVTTSEPLAPDLVLLCPECTEIAETRGLEIVER